MEGVSDKTRTVATAVAAAYPSQVCRCLLLGGVFWLFSEFILDQRPNVSPFMCPTGLDLCILPYGVEVMS